MNVQDWIGLPVTIEFGDEIVGHIVDAKLEKEAVKITVSINEQEIKASVSEAWLKHQL